MQSFTGTVISDKMKNTLTVVVNFSMRHPKYKKIIKKTTKLHVHNEIEGIKTGDRVTIVQSRPYSKTIHFQTKKVVEQSTQPNKVETKPAVEQVKKSEVARPKVNKKASK